jgi:hypothetical protein
MVQTRRPSRFLPAEFTPKGADTKHKLCFQLWQIMGKVTWWIYDVLSASQDQIESWPEPLKTLYNQYRAAYEARDEALLARMRKTMKAEPKKLVQPDHDAT